MSTIKWSDEYSVGVKQIDDQHKNLVDLINRLFDAMSLGKGKEVLGGVFDELKKYTIIHFQTEERLMVVYGYPDYEAHKKSHEDLVQNNRLFSNSWNTGFRNTFYFYLHRKFKFWNFESEFSCSHLICFHKWCPVDGWVKILKVFK